MASIPSIRFVRSVTPRDVAAAACLAVLGHPGPRIHVPARRAKRLSTPAEVRRIESRYGPAIRRDSEAVPQRACAAVVEPTEVPHPAIAAAARTGRVRAESFISRLLRLDSEARVLRRADETPVKPAIRVGDFSSSFHVPSAKLSEPHESPNRRGPGEARRTAPAGTSQGGHGRRPCPGGRGGAVDGRGHRVRRDRARRAAAGSRRPRGVPSAFAATGWAHPS